MIYTAGDKRIITFADLENPSKTEYSLETIQEGLDHLVSSGFDYFSPEKIPLHFLGNLARFEPDSEYAVRIDLTKKFLASSLYSGDELSQFFQDIAIQNLKAADQEALELESKAYKIKKSIKLVPERIRRSFGIKGRFTDIYVFSYDQEKKGIAKKRILNDVYNNFCEITRNISQDFTKNLTISEITELIEINQPFSKKLNNCEKNITFVDPRIRNYGFQIQQQLQRIWFNQIVEDSMYLLTIEQLLGQE